MNTGERGGRRSADRPDLVLGQGASLMQNIRERAGCSCEQETAILADSLQCHDAGTLCGLQAASLTHRMLIRGTVLQEQVNIILH